jgi:predicted RND superfamily exporter protein
LLFDVKINFLNFIALPITFGIGVDYAVNIFHRYVEDPTGDIIKVIRETGAAVGICSLTTNIGYSSLLIAGNQAFVSFGTLAVIGEITTLLAALFTVPAYILVRQKYR